MKCLIGFLGCCLSDAALGRPAASYVGLYCHSGPCLSFRGRAEAKRCRGRWPVWRAENPSLRLSDASTMSAAARRQACCVFGLKTTCSGRARPTTRGPERAMRGRRGSSLGNCRWRWACGKGVAMMVPAMLPNCAGLHIGRSLLASGMNVTTGSVDWTATPTQGEACLGPRWTWVAAAPAGGHSTSFYADAQKLRRRLQHATLQRSS
jgi:hypothetical protein